MTLIVEAVDKFYESNRALLNDAMLHAHLDSLHPCEGRGMRMSLRFDRQEEGRRGGLYVTFVEFQGITCWKQSESFRCAFSTFVDSKGIFHDPIPQEDRSPNQDTICALASIETRLVVG